MLLSDCEDFLCSREWYVTLFSLQNGRLFIVGRSTVFEKCRGFLADVGRLESVFWRLWHRELTSLAMTLKSSSPSLERVLLSHRRRLIPEPTDGSDELSVHTDEKSGSYPFRFVRFLYSH